MNKIIFILICMVFLTGSVFAQNTNQLIKINLLLDDSGMNVVRIIVLNNQIYESPDDNYYEANLLDSGDLIISSSRFDFGILTGSEDFVYASVVFNYSDFSKIKYLQILEESVEIEKFDIQLLSCNNDEVCEGMENYGICGDCNIDSDDKECYSPEEDGYCDEDCFDDPDCELPPEERVDKGSSSGSSSSSSSSSSGGGAFPTGTPENVDEGEEESLFQKLFGGDEDVETKDGESNKGLGKEQQGLLKNNVVIYFVVLFICLIIVIGLLIKFGIIQKLYYKIIYRV